MILERRAAKRRIVSERGVAIVDGVKRFVDITDISAKGARLAFGAKAPLPLRFRLVFANGRQVACQTVWQQDLIAGVQFAKSPIWKRVALRRS